MSEDSGSMSAETLRCYEDGWTAAKSGDSSLPDLANNLLRDAWRDGHTDYVNMAARIARA